MNIDPRPLGLLVLIAYRKDRHTVSVVVVRPSTISKRNVSEPTGSILIKLSVNHLLVGE